MFSRKYRVVELASYIAAPAAAGILADWGADVIKIEPLGGDPARFRWPAAEPGGASPNFEFDNRGKRSIAIDVRTPEGQEIIQRLLSDADVFITNLRPASAKRLGLDYDTLHKKLPRLVYTSITGYGLGKELADVPAYDITAFWSYSGLGGQLWPRGFPPMRWRPGVGDHIAALAVALGTVTALLNRSDTGQGSLVESSLIRAGTYVGGFDLAYQLRSDKTLGSFERNAPGAPPSMFFPVMDDQWIAVVPNTEKDWPTIFDAAGRSDLREDERFSSEKSRAAHGVELNAELDAGFGSFSLEEAAERLTSRGVVWGPVLTAQQVVNDPVVKAAGCFVDVARKNGENFQLPAPAVRLQGGDAPKGPSPNIGEHTGTVLREAGYSTDEIEGLRRNKIVASDDDAKIEEGNN